LAIQVSLAKILVAHLAAKFNPVLGLVQPQFSSMAVENPGDKLAKKRSKAPLDPKLFAPRSYLRFPTGQQA
jgi:hypothetical protein